MTRYLSQLLLRVFVFPQCPFHTRAHPWDFALFAFTTFTERDPKNVGVFLENVQRFSFFLRRFLKNVGRFYELLPTFLKVAAVCRQTGCLESHFFLFLCRKKCLFSALVCEGCESKKVQIPGNAPACHVRARKGDFFEGKIISSSSVFHWGKKWLQISLPSLEYFKPQNHDDCFLWNNMIKSNVFMMIVFAWFCNVWIPYLIILAVDTSLFRRFFTLLSPFPPLYIRGGKRRKLHFARKCCRIFVWRTWMSA